MRYVPENNQVESIVDSIYMVYDSNQSGLGWLEWFGGGGGGCFGSIPSSNFLNRSGAHRKMNFPIPKGFLVPSQHSVCFRIWRGWGKLCKSLGLFHVKKCWIICPVFWHLLKLTRVRAMRTFAPAQWGSIMANVSENFPLFLRPRIP